MENKKILIIALLFFVFISCGTVCQTVSAATPLYVNGASGDDTYDGTSATYTTGTFGPKKTIQNAINAVTNGGVVNVANGVYNEHITIDKSVTINGANRDNTIIDGTHNGRIIDITENHTVHITHVTLRNGDASDSSSGGAIFNYNSILTISDCTLSANIASEGGAIKNYRGILTISGSTFTGNNAELGGAIWNEGNLFISGSTLTDNTASEGGAIWNHHSTLSISGSTFTDNAAGRGGAIYNNGDDGIITISGSTFTGNNAELGGAFYNNYGNIYISASNLNKNTAGNAGGVIFNGGICTITASNLNENKGLEASVIFNGGKAYITYSTLSNNINTEYSGVIDNHFGTMVLKFNRIIANTNIQVNNEYNLDDGVGSLDARYNWWGSSQSPSSKVSKYVKYSPWLVAPTVISTNPKNGAKKISRTQTIIIKFSNKITASTAWSKIIVKKNGKKVYITKKWINGNTLYLKTKKRAKNAYYTISIPTNAIKDYYNINLLKQYALKFRSK